LARAHLMVLIRSVLAACVAVLHQSRPCRSPTQEAYEHSELENGCWKVGDLTLVTGASGFVGSAIAKVFRESGHQVRALVRPLSPRTNITPADMVVTGDICDRNAVAAAVRNVRYVIHSAADYRLWTPIPAEIFRTNVEGTRIVMEEALRAGVERIVYTSSVATIELRAGAPADESRPLAENQAVGAYKRSKVIAERMVEDMVKTAGLPAVIVNPSTPIGPRDIRPTPTGRIIVEAARGRMPAFVDTGLNLVHVDDVAAGHLEALRRGTIGERYILGGENVYLPWGGECVSARYAGGNRASDRAPASQAAASHRGCLSACCRHRDLVAHDRARTIRDPRWASDGTASYVFPRCQGPT
jgi:dihydroflavonol-4-reductase